MGSTARVQDTMPGYMPVCRTVSRRVSCQSGGKCPPGLIAFCGKWAPSFGSHNVKRNHDACKKSLIWHISPKESLRTLARNDTFSILWLFDHFGLLAKQRVLALEIEQKIPVSLKSGQNTSSFWRVSDHYDKSGNAVSGPPFLKPPLCLNIQASRKVQNTVGIP